MIAKHYLMAWFWIDLCNNIHYILVSTFPFDTIVNAST